MSSKDSQSFLAPNQLLQAENAQRLISTNFGVEAANKAKITCVTLGLSGKTVKIVSEGDLVLQGRT